MATNVKRLPDILSLISSLTKPEYRASIPREKNIAHANNSIISTMTPFYYNVLRYHIILLSYYHTLPYQFTSIFNSILLLYYDTILLPYYTINYLILGTWFYTTNDLNTRYIILTYYTIKYTVLHYGRVPIEHTHRFERNRRSTRRLF
jgi:hypothetical protein